MNCFAFIKMAFFSSKDVNFFAFIKMAFYLFFGFFFFLGMLFLMDILVFWLCLFFLGGGGRELLGTNFKHVAAKMLPKKFLLQL